MKYQIVILLLLFANTSFSQCPTPKLSATGKSIEKFVPKGWFILDSAYGDFNNDKLRDVVLVLAYKEDDNTGGDEGCNRTVAILQKMKIGYKLSAHTNNGVLCKGCGGAFGDPYASISLKKNVLTINHYGGSAWRWSENFTFRFKNNEWYLIGASYNSYWNVMDCEDGVGSGARNFQDANFVTCKAHIIRTKDDACKPYKNYWVAFKRKPLLLLNKFDVGKNYFPFKVD